MTSNVLVVLSAFLQHVGEARAGKPKLKRKRKDEGAEFQVRRTYCSCTTHACDEGMFKHMGLGLGFQK